MFRILYVDDDITLLQAGKDFVEREGKFSLEIITSAPAALELLNSKTFDAIISGYQMPGMDGIEFLKRVRGSGKTIPFILFAGTCREDLVIRALNEGADYYLRKGGDPGSLIVELPATLHRVIRKRRTETEREAVEAEYRNLFNNAGDAIVIHIPEGRFLAVNDEICRRLKYSREDLMQMNPADLYETLDDGDIRNLLRKLKQDGKVVFETVHLASDGTRIPTEVSCRVMTYRGEPAVLSLARDLTDRKQAEQKLRESEERLNVAQRLARMGDVTWDLTTGEILWSDGIYNLLQYDRSEKFDMDRVNREIHHPEDLERVTAWLNDCIASGGNVITPNEYRIIRKDGMELFVHTSGVIQRVDGKAVRIFVALQDITERKESQKLLEILSRSLTDTLIMAKMAAWDYDVASETFIFNDAFYAMHGMTARDAGGFLVPALTFTENFTTPHYAGQMSDTIRQAVDSSDPDFDLTIEGELRRMDGSTFWVTTWLRTEQDHAGNVVSLHGVNQDITERKRNEEALRNINRHLNLLISVTRHDIHNQLLSLKAYLELSKSTPGVPAITLAFIAKEEQSVRSVERQIAFTKEYQKLGVTPPVWQNVGNCIRAAITELDLRDVVLDLRGMDTLEIMADPLLTKVFYNLVDNALRHGSDSMTNIGITSHESDRGLVILVEDNGSGIPAEEKESVFERGYGRNSGYGLFFVREIMGITGILIRETGEPGTGARFEILVPEPTYRFCS